MNLFRKLQVFIEMIKVVKNWHVIPSIYFKLTNKELVTLITRTGIKIKIRTSSTDLMAFTNVWVIKEYSKLGFEIKDEDTVIDVGAHIGLFSLFASQFCKKGKIFSFEPIKENFELLKENIRINDITNISLFNEAISNTTSKITLYQNEDEAGHSKFIKTSKSIQVNSKAFKEFIDEREIEKCGLLKLDCEGSEYEIIESLPPKYFEKFKKIIIEYHLADTKPNLIRNLKANLINSSYDISIKPIFEDIGFVYAKKHK
jgi:FkbM family methyltransferase